MTIAESERSIDPPVTWRPDLLLRVLLLWTSLLTSVQIWVPLVRASIEGAAAVLYAAINHPEELFFEGGTLGVRSSLVKSGPAFFGSVAICVLFWVIRDLRSHRAPSPRWVWTRGKRVRFALAVGIVPAQIILLRSWGPLGPGAMVGVILSIWQWFLITQALLAPARISAAQPRAGAL